MIPSRTLDLAAFWDQAICLDCGGVQPEEDMDEALEEAMADGRDVFPATCSLCGSEGTVYSAKFIQRVRDLCEAGDD